VRRFRRRDSSRNQGGEWNAAISKYIGNIPSSSDRPAVAEHSMAGMSPS